MVSHVTRIHSLTKSIAHIKLSNIHKFIQSHLTYSNRPADRQTDIGIPSSWVVRVQQPNAQFRFVNQFTYFLHSLYVVFCFVFVLNNKLITLRNRRQNIDTVRSIPSEHSRRNSTGIVVQDSIILWHYDAYYHYYSISLHVFSFSVFSLWSVLLGLGPIHRFYLRWNDVSFEYSSIYIHCSFDHHQRIEWMCLHSIKTCIVDCGRSSIRRSESPLQNSIERFTASTAAIGQETNFYYFVLIFCFCFFCTYSKLS